MPHFAIPITSSRLVLLLTIVALGYWTIVMSLMIVSSLVPGYPSQLAQQQPTAVNDFFTPYDKAVALLYSGKPNESIAYFDKALSINPNDVTSLTQKGIALIFLNKPNQSIAYFDKALSINPNDVNSLTQKGLALGRLGEYNESIAYFDKALAIDPKFYIAIKEKEGFVAGGALLTRKGLALK